MTGGYITIGHKPNTFKSMLRFITKEYKLQYQCYQTKIDGILTVVVQVYIDEKQYYIRLLTGELEKLEERIINMFPAAQKVVVKFEDIAKKPFNI